MSEEVPAHLKDVVIGRYLSFSAFLDLLVTSTLRLTKISLFEDQAEGVPQYNQVIESLKNSTKYVGPAYSDERKENILKTIENYYASCWVMKKAESYLMWKNYSNFHEGILLLSTIGQLINSLEMRSFETKDRDVINWFFGKVDYSYRANYASDHLRAFGKTQYFEDENEFRLVMYRHPSLSEESFPCKILNIDFISKIVCAPRATQQFYDLVVQIARDHSMRPNIVRKSEIVQNSRLVLEGFLESDPKA